MNEEDQMLCAWLKKREFQIVANNFNHLWLCKQRVTAYKHYDVEPEHLNLWVSTQAVLDSHTDIFVHRTQGVGRRPLRSLVREWVIGL